MGREFCLVMSEGFLSRLKGELEVVGTETESRGAGEKVEFID